MLRRDRVYDSRGYSLITWVTVLIVVVASFLFIRVSFKRALQNRVAATADYMLWTKWGQKPQDFKGEDTSFVRTDSEQEQYVKSKERAGVIKSRISATANENTVSTGVEEGSQPILKTFDLNNVLD